MSKGEVSEPKNKTAMKEIKDGWKTDIDDLMKRFKDTEYKIPWNNSNKLAKDCWLFLTDDSMPKEAKISKKAFIHEVGAMIESVKLHFKTQTQEQ